MEAYEALQMLHDEYGEDNVLYDPLTRVARVKDVGTMYIPTKLNIKHQLIADLKATGMMTTEACRMVTGNPDASAVHAGKVMKSPVAKKYTDEQVESVRGAARDRLAEVIVQAADNIANQVEIGDYNASVKVLAGTGVLVQKSTKEIVLPDKFGAWLAAEQQQKEIGFGDTVDVTPAIKHPVDTETHKNMPILPTAEDAI